MGATMHFQTGLSQIFLTISSKPSRCSHPSSNLNRRVHGGLGKPVVNKMGAWSDRSWIRSRAHTDTKGNFDSQSVSISTRSSFSYVGSGRLFAQVKILPIIETSLKSKLSMTVLSRKGQWLSNRPLLFSNGNRSKLNSPPNDHGVGVIFC